MWQVQETEKFAGRRAKFAKDRPRELFAAQRNLHRYLQTLQAGVKPLQVSYGFIHTEGMGVVAIDQAGGTGKGLAEFRLYVYPDSETETLYLITLAEKRTQKRDVKECHEFVNFIRQHGKPTPSTSQTDPEETPAHGPDEQGQKSTEPTEGSGEEV